jgi:hypothetical protein
MPLRRYAVQCLSQSMLLYSFAMLVAASLLPCPSVSILCQAIVLRNIANLRPAMPLPLVACQNFASPLLIETQFSFAFAYLNGAVHT